MKLLTSFLISSLFLISNILQPALANMPFSALKSQVISNRTASSVSMVLVKMTGGVPFYDYGSANPEAIVVIKTEAELERIIRSNVAVLQSNLDENQIKEAIASYIPMLTDYYARGSGTVLNRDGVLLTNAHVIYDEVLKKPVEDITLFFTLDTKLPPECLAKGKVVDYDLETDLAIIKPSYSVDQDCEKNQPMQRISQRLSYISFRADTIDQSDIPEVGEEVTVLGYPSIGGTSLNAAEGIISGYLFSKDNSSEILAIKTSANIDPGNSGGAALDANGDFIGIPSYGAFDSSRGARLNAIIALDVIKSWINYLESSNIIDLNLNIAPAVEPISSDYEVNIDYEIVSPTDYRCFTDITPEYFPQWRAICRLKNAKVLSGYPDGSFGGYNFINRAEFLKILIGGIGVNPDINTYNNCFPDVKDEWFAPYICYAKTKKIISGYPDGTFRPTSNVNYGEAYKMLFETFKVEIPDNLYNASLVHVNSTDWFAKYMSYAYNSNLFDTTIKYPSSEEFRPWIEAYRARISESLYRTIFIIKYGLDVYDGQ